MPVDLVSRSKGSSSGGTVVIPPIVVASSYKLIDSAGVVWAVTAGTNGNLITTVSSGAAYSFFVIQDINGNFWRVFLSGTSGNLDTSENGIPGMAINLFLTDSNSRNWYVFILPSGDLDTL